MTVIIICTFATVDNDRTCVYECTYRCVFGAGIHLRLRITKYIDFLLFVRYSVGLHVSDAK
jgi:hypothetical protein